MSDIETHPLPPFLPPNAKLLMLGSFPPPATRWKMNFYYPNYQNDMWRIFGLIFFQNKDYFLDIQYVNCVFVFPTRQDAWGLVVNEAMANGLPVVSTQKCVAALEMIKEGKNGYVVPINDVLELKTAVENIMESQELRYAMSKESIETMKKKYTIENMAKEHIKIFEKEKKGRF